MSLSLNPRLIAGKPPACKVDATALQETDLRPEAAETGRETSSDTGRVEACASDGNGNPPTRHVEIA